MESPVRYDAAIIGAGAEGLAAAVILAKARQRVIVIERSERAGGRLTTREFHPGFRASPFADDVSEIPAELFWTLELTRHGAIVAPARASRAVWPDREHDLPRPESSRVVRFLHGVARERNAIVERVLAAAKAPQTRGIFRRPDRGEWPGSELASASVADVLARETATADEAAHLAALVLSGRAVDPRVPGSAPHLLSANGALGFLPGGLGRLGAALVSAAKAEGVAFSFGLEASELHRKDKQIVGIGLADGSEVAARAVISTLDLKRTFLNFFAWNAVPKPLMRSVSAFRMSGGLARVLFALEGASDLARLGSGPICVAPSIEDMSTACQAWRAGTIAARAPVTLRVVSARDPSLALAPRAVVTATLSAIPFRLFDGSWTHEKREELRARAVSAAEEVFPGFGAHVVAAEVIAPPDIENALGATDGDMLGGEIAVDQMLGEAPWQEPAIPRTPIPGLYLAGSHLNAGAFATCAAGAAAAYALLADLAAGHLK